MMQDSHNQDTISGRSIENAVLPMDKAAKSVAKFRPKRSSKREVAQPLESRIEALHIDFGYIFTKPHNAEFVDLNQVCFRSVREFNFSHAWPCAGR